MAQTIFMISSRSLPPQKSYFKFKKMLCCVQFVEGIV